MASMKEIREHIASIQSTQKVTNAMYLIASTKMRRAKEDLAKTRPFFDAVSTQIEQIFRHAGEIESPYLYRGNADDLAQPGTYAYLVVTADRGLAGAYNQNVIQETMKRLEKHPDSRLFVVGGNGRHFFSGHGVPVEKSFRYDAQSPTLRRAREITAKPLDLFDRGEISKLFIIYTDLGNGVDMDVRTVRLLPLEDEHFAKEETEEKPIRFEPSAGSCRHTSRAFCTRRWSTAFAPSRTRAPLPWTRPTRTRTTCCASCSSSTTTSGRAPSRARSRRSPPARAARRTT